MTESEEFQTTALPYHVLRTVLVALNNIRDDNITVFDEVCVAVARYNFILEYFRSGM